MSEQEKISEVFAAIVEYAERHGVRNIGDLPGCWEFAPDNNWWIACNGHKVELACSRNTKVPPFNAYVEWCGWPAGFVGPRGGVIAAGEAANEAALIKALKDAR